jgi:hypothetical protein
MPTSEARGLTPYKGQGLTPSTDSGRTSKGPRHGGALALFEPGASGYSLRMIPRMFRIWMNSVMKLP